MDQPIDRQISELPGEQRGIPTVNQIASATLKRGLVMPGLFIFCVIIGMIYWNYRYHANQINQTTAQEDIHLTSVIPTRTFVDPPASKVPPPLPDAHLFDSKNHFSQFSRSSNRMKPPQVLDKAGSSLMVTSASGAVQQNKMINATADGDNHGMAKLLSGTSTSMRQAELLSNRNFVLAKGSFIDCALQTKLDSTVPGMTSCIVTRDIYSDNGKLVLIERGSTVSGEYKSNLRQGMARIFVLWTRIKTPNGVIVNLDSPGADQLGGAGIPGYIDNHFWQRFGGALLLSLVDDVAGATSAKINKQNKGQITFNESMSTTQDMATEALKNTINIPPTLYKNQGEQIGIYVARDLDFSSVYDVANH